MTDHQICDACECVSHCRKNGCVPLTPMPEEADFAIAPSTDAKTLQRELAIAYEGLVRERVITKEQGERIKELERALRDLISWVPGRECWHSDAPGDAVLTARSVLARAALSKVPQ